MFPIFKFMFNDGPRLSTNEASMLMQNTYGLNLNQFTTFIGHFLLIYNKASFLVISLMYNIILYLVFRKTFWNS